MIEEKQPLENSYQASDTSVVSEAEEIGTSAPLEPEIGSGASSDSEPQMSEDSLVDVESVADLDTANSDEQVANQTGAYAEEVATLKQKVEELKAQLDVSNNQLESAKNQYMRIAADFDNFRKRTQKEKEDLELQVKSTTLTKLLAVVDDFERARSLIKPQTDGETGIHKSYQGVYKQLVEALKRLGVSPMRPEGREFDPNLHEAVMREPTNEHPEGTVLEELVRGYFLGDRILRHAMVKVAAPLEEQVTTTEEDQPENTES